MGDDVLDVLRLAVDRKPVFDAFHDGGLTRSGIENALSVSPSTAHRVAKELVSYGIVVRRDGVYELTPFGRVVARETERAVNTIATANRLSPLLDTLDDINGELGMFSDGTVTKPEPGDPHRPIRRFLTPVPEASHIRELSPTAPEPSFQHVLYERAQEELQAELLYPPDVVDQLRAEDQEAFRRATASGNLRLRVVPRPPFRLLLTDDRVYVGGYNMDISALEIVVDTDNADAIAWATRCFEKRWQSATPYEEYRANGD